MRSIYWKCYGFPASEDNVILTRAKIVCLLCKTQIAYNRNTSNLRMHLQNKHKQELETLELVHPLPNCKSGVTDKRSVKKPRKGQKQDQTMMQVYPVENQNEEHLTSNSSMPFIADMDELNPLRVIVKEATSNQMYTLVDGKLIADAIAEFLIMDMQLPDIVEGRGFQRLIATLKSPCEIPSKIRLAEEIIPRMFSSVKEHLLPEIDSLALDISLSVEDWVSSSGDVYSTVSIHYISDNENELQSKVLSTIYCSEVDALHWGSQFDAMILEWNIKLSKVKAIIVASDREDVYDSLIARSFIVIPCLSHTLQIACMKACLEKPDVVDILNKCRAILALVSRSPNANEALKYQDNVLQLEENSFVMDQSSMWVTTFTMLEQLLARRHVLPGVIEALCASVCPISSLELTESQWSIVEDVINVLSPFKVTMVTLNEEKCPLVSILKPIMWQLLHVHLEKHDTDSEYMLMFKSELTQILSEKYKDPKVNEILEIATVLDPRFKKLPFMSDDGRPVLIEKLKQMLYTQVSARQVDEECKESTNKKPRLSGMEYLLGDLCVPKSEMPSNQRADLELVQYECESPANLEKLPIEWWKETGGKCGQLSKLAFQYLCIPVCINSYLNANLYQKPTIQSLSPQLVHKMKFLHRNYSPL
ncbi:hypothetical protein AAG570_003472 [Ranatra chinensis]|uniref:BED-type domain-containing protein n=1 Tax=Ranatra chinensis TaxID=642074 RepID=A0ABD0Y3R0_9HEMI